MIVIAQRVRATSRTCRSRAKQHCSIRYYDIVALPGIMSSLKLDCLHNDNICEMFQCQKLQAFKICADAPGLSGLAPALFCAGFSSRRMGAPAPRSAPRITQARASVKRRSPQTRSRVGPGQLSPWSNLIELFRRLAFPLAAP